MSTTSQTPSLTPSRSPTPAPPVQPDHFYGAQDVHLPPSPHSNGKTWLDPEDDPFAHRGIPVFKPSMEEFQDFEQYMNQIECWGMKSGIVKVIPPKEWIDALPPYKEQLKPVKIKSPIEQHMLGRGGLFRQENVEKRRLLSVREWSELCAKDELRTPGIDDVGLHARSSNAAANAKVKMRRGRKKADEHTAETAEPELDGDLEIKQEAVEDEPDAEDGAPPSSVVSPPNTASAPSTPAATTTVHGHDIVESAANADVDMENEAKPVADKPAVAEPLSLDDDDKVKAKPKRVGQTREAREASLAERAARDAVFLDAFDPHKDWLPSNTKGDDYTFEFCQKLERQYWRNCGLGKPAWYGADTQGSLFTDDAQCWNVARLPSLLSRILPSSSKGLPGVNTPYLYFGMWRATFAWHVEDMDLFSINYIHFGAPKFWYAIPQSRATAMENTMRGYFPKDTSQCPQFLRHKSFLASPTVLAQSSCRPNILVQQEGEFVITYPRGYHAGFNLGFNCAESVNFALDSWLELGRKAKACECIADSVRIDVDELLREREEDLAKALAAQEALKAKFKRSPKVQLDENGKPKSSRKRKSDASDSPKAKKAKSGDGDSSKPPSKPMVTLKLGPKPPQERPFPCCLCVSMSEEGLLPVHDPPVGIKDSTEHGQTAAKIWMAHDICASVIPETWVDETEAGEIKENGTRDKQRMVFGVDAIVKDRWNLKCSACAKPRHKAHGAPVQCTKGKCPKAFHVSCARDGADQGIVFQVVREVEKEVVLLENTGAAPAKVPPRPESCIAPGDVVPAAASLAATNAMQVDVQTIPQPSQSPISPGGEPGPEVLKVIKKLEVHLLCSQHNPEITAAKKASKQDKIRNILMTLPPMSRLKVRVSAGVFEVSLVRVIETTGSVEVLWDRGIKREFKWGSVVFGNTEGQMVQQKPADFAAAPERQVAVADPSSSTSPPVVMVAEYCVHPRVIQAPTPSSAPMHSLSPPAPTPQFPSYTPAPPYNTYSAGSWTYQYQYQHPTVRPGYPPTFAQPAPTVQPPPVQNSLINPPYYSNSPAGAPPYQPYPANYPANYAAGYPPYYPPTSTAQPYRQIQWQQPYLRPRESGSSSSRPQSRTGVSARRSASVSSTRGSRMGTPANTGEARVDSLPACALSSNAAEVTGSSRPVTTPLTLQAALVASEREPSGGMTATDGFSSVVYQPVSSHTT